ncbi:MAG: MFS transporter [Nanoarchaeota archaeon]|nr:MFS transporter [Nanoarchaeota archaeon]
MDNNHHLLWYFRPKKELTQIYLCLMLRNFALSLIGLFVPLYLYKELSYTLSQTLYFYIFYALIFAISTPVAAKFASKYGVKHTILLSVPFFLIFVSLLQLLTIIKIPLMVVASFQGLAISFFWMGIHLIFYHASHKKHRGEEMGKRTGLSIIASMFGPLIGGVIIKFVGFWLVFVLVALILIISAGVLFFSKEEYVKYSFSLKSVVDKEHWKNSLFFVSRGSRVMAEGVIWPIFIFVILNDYVSLGLMGFVLSGIGAILIVVVGKYSDHKSKSKLLHWITGFESLAWIMRAFVQTVTHVFGATIFGAITYGVREAPMGALEYDKARKSDPVGYFVSREIFICLGRILMLVFVLMTNSLSGGLVFHGFVNLAALLF